MRINLVATGGTIGSRYENGELVISDDATAQIASVIGASKVFGEFKIHSASVGFAALNMLRQSIERALEDKPDGVIVTHGTDTLAFSSAYLSYAFSATRVPIVMCAADKPLTDDDSNGFAVLNAAKSFIAPGKRSGVFVLYKNPGEVVRIHHGARVIPAHMHEDFYFSIGGVNTFENTGLMRGMDFDLVDSKVLCVFPYVGMDYSTFDMQGCKAVVHMGYHSGRIHIDEFNKFARAHKNIPMFLITGAKKYDPALFADNVTLCPSITQTALYIKLLIGIKNNVKDLTGWVLKNACGEIV